MCLKSSPSLPVMIELRWWEVIYMIKNEVVILCVFEAHKITTYLFSPLYITAWDVSAWWKLIGRAISWKRTRTHLTPLYTIQHTVLLARYTPLLSHLISHVRYGPQKRSQAWSIEQQQFTTPLQDHTFVWPYKDVVARAAPVCSLWSLIREEILELNFTQLNEQQTTRDYLYWRRWASLSLISINILLKSVT